jgi:hypothetical protein
MNILNLKILSFEILGHENYVNVFYVKLIMTPSIAEMYKNINYGLFFR